MMMKPQIDVKGFRLSKLNQKQYRHLWLLAFWPLFGVFFKVLEDAFAGPYHPVRCALDDAMDVLERQIRRNRTRLEKRKQISEEAYRDFSPDDAEEDIRISKVKQFDLHPMTVEEAILQMNLLSHEFFLFKNAETGVLNVVYKRKNNDYGLIEPKE